MIRPTVLAILMVLASNLEGQVGTGCYAVSHDQITGSDLATVIPELAVLAPDLKLGYAPSPGAQREFRAVDLQQLAKRYGIETRFTKPVCFAWPMHALAKDVIVAAMQKSLAGQDVQLELTDQAHTLVPDGEVNFPLQGFSGESDKPGVWNGFITYAGTRKFNTWAQVRVTVHEKHLLAARPIAAGEVLDLSDLKKVDYDGPLRHVPVLQQETEVAGKSARWSIAAGSVLVKNMLVPPQDVEKEQMVTVRIDSGATHIETQGIANEAGYRGNVIRVRNPKTGRVFRARIDDQGVVTVVPGGMFGLVVEEKKS